MGNRPGGISHSATKRGIDKFIQNKCRCLQIFLASPRDDFGYNIRVAFTTYPNIVIKAMTEATIAYITQLTPAGKPIAQSVKWNAVNEENRLDLSYEIEQASRTVGADQIALVRDL